MKFQGLSATGFGGIAGTTTVDLSADVVILLGANGFGKSTICDAVTWCLTGEHPRSADPRCLYSLSGETQVTVVLREDSGNHWTVRRIVTNPEAARGAKLKTSVIVSGPEDEWRDLEASAWLGRSLLPQPNSEPAHYAQALRDSFYLQQEQLREFLTRRTDDERFSTLSRMVGSGSLTDLVRAFESSKNVWTRAINKTVSDSEPLRDRVEDLRRACREAENQLERSQTPQISQPYRAWWAETTKVLDASSARTNEGDQSEGAFASRVKSLENRRTYITYRLDTLESLLAEVRAPVPPAPQQSNEDQTVDRLRIELDRLRADLAGNARQLSVLHAQADQQRTAREELQAMARLALNHVSDSCPLCGQSTEPNDFVVRLTEMLEETSEPAALVTALNQATDERDRLSLRLGALEEELVIAEQVRDRVAQANRARAAIMERRREREMELAGLLNLEQGAPVNDWDSAVAEERTHYDDEFKQITRLLASAEFLRADLDVQQSRSRLSALQRELAALDGDYAAIEFDVEARRQTAAATDLLLRALREDAENFVTRRLNDIQPVLDQLYASIDPHPTFRSIRMATHNWYGKNRLSAILMDDSQGVEVRDPEVTLSTSQANALAVALFLAFNLGLKPTSLSSVVLDDPLQNLDDLHLLGLVDLLRRISEHRQIIITTHDSSFASLLTRKLRPVNENKRLSVIRIMNWDRQGPNIMHDTLMPDPFPLKLAKA